ncbi:ornithine cyclodeaminase family protein [Kineococcus sp. SYSU DK006]|uniref:ornithine cyclodeaminase family protein n=1 Tax=Kineococcus sp. SYSU DK006 TaxID=3383127 RepID=UPI003D7C3D3E
MRIIDADQLYARVPWNAAIQAIEAAARGGRASAPPRMAVALEAGELLLMPAHSATAVGVKVVGVAPSNTGRGLPRIQASYLLLDPVTLTPQALLDGTALTTVRTPALSAVAVRHLAAPLAQRLVVVGSGPQAWGHAHAIASVRALDDICIVGRSAQRAAHLAARLSEEGLPARAGTLDQVPEADIVVCATTSSTPVLPTGLVPAHACVVAVGSHHRGFRELESALLRRASSVVVEQRKVALREAGDIVLALSDGAVQEDDLIELTELLTSSRSTTGRQLTVFKSVGMGWQDLVVAELAAAVDPASSSTA